MEVDSKELYETTFEQCMLLQKQMLMYKTLYIQTKKELDIIKNNEIENKK